MAHSTQAERPIPLEEALAASGVPVTSATIRRALAAGRIVGLRIGGRWRTTPEAIIAALVRQVGPPTNHLPTFDLGSEPVGDVRATL